MEHTEELIARQLREGREEAYAYLFSHHYAVLCHIAEGYVHDSFTAETIVGDTIFHLWEVRSELEISTSLRAYLAQSVRRRCLDYLKSRQCRQEKAVRKCSLEQLPAVQYLCSDDYPLGRLLEKELEEKITEAVGKLPEKCRRVFCMSRFEGRCNEDIARELAISVSTVKYHLATALSFLRGELGKYLVILLILGI
ncbi:RNA polymerase sigma-70 factor [Prevotella sp. kh1p2]|uniref:RNA polymerase sigma-70 factor n=1 Tax=Prevotella sp. kh1p2 TaxID=1761883 RepID=UPI0008C02DF0|nr:RNA polymerase sigma-70 factor [Prevotella sp. kh1p2]SES70909.1 RNA polymerase sigma-70 factor, ECF subfamily [Prevotella sp. kh1p2]SNU10394.1 RNA polymerase sigma-70 factor, ECF subfamily [Prevotellaceae bacterium KH2P17]